MTTLEELNLILELLRKHNLPISPILEYAINEKIDTLPKSIYKEASQDESIRIGNVEQAEPTDAAEMGFSIKQELPSDISARIPKKSEPTARQTVSTGGVTLPKPKQRFNEFDIIETADCYETDKSKGKFIMTHKVDWSFLTNGINIQVKYQSALRKALWYKFNRGDTRTATIIVGNEAFKVKFFNMNLDVKRGSKAHDVIQFRYYNTAFPRRMQELMPELYHWIEKKRLGSSRTQVHEPRDLSRTFSLYAMPQEDVFLIEISDPKMQIHQNPKPSYAIQEDKIDFQSGNSVDRHQFNQYLDGLCISASNTLRYKRSIDDEAIVAQIKRLAGKDSIFDVTDIKLLEQVRQIITSDYKWGYPHAALQHYIEFLRKRNDKHTSLDIPFNESHQEEMKAVDLSQNNDSIGNRQDDNIIIKKPLEIVEYNSRSFVVIGTTKPFKEIWKTYNGIYNPYLEYGKGWIFNMKQRESIQRIIDELNTKYFKPGQSEEPKQKSVRQQEKSSVANHNGLTPGTSIVFLSIRGVISKSTKSFCALHKISTIQDLMSIPCQQLKQYSYANPSILDELERLRNLCSHFAELPPANPVITINDKTGSLPLPPEKSKITADDKTNLQKLDVNLLNPEDIDSLATPFYQSAIEIIKSLPPEMSILFKDNYKFTTLIRVVLSKSGDIDYAPLSLSTRNITQLRRVLVSTVNLWKRIPTISSSIRERLTIRSTQLERTLEDNNLIDMYFVLPIDIQSELQHKLDYQFRFLSADAQKVFQALCVFKKILPYMFSLKSLNAFRVSFESPIRQEFGHMMRDLKKEYEETIRKWRNEK